MLQALAVLLFAAACTKLRAQALARVAGDAAPARVTLRPRVGAGINLRRSRIPGTAPRIGLVLSGGGSRGFAQIGVLKVLEQLGVFPDAIVGTSIGALLGGLYADGYSAADLDSIARATDWNDLLGIGEEARRSELFIDQKVENDRSLLTLHLDGLTPMVPEAVSTGSRMTQFIEGLVWRGPYHYGGSFDNLKYRFRAVATDLAKGRTIVLDSGNLAMAMRASATVPLRFSPVAFDSVLLVDGGLLENVPVPTARALGCDVVIVVNTTSPLMPAEKLNTPWNVADQVVTLMMRERSRDAIADADLVISPSLGDMDASDFTIAAAAIDSGEAEARRSIAALTRLVGPQQAHRANGAWPVAGRNTGDERLLMLLGCDGATVDANRIQERLDYVAASGAYVNLEATIDYLGNGAHVTVTGSPAPLVAAVRLHHNVLIDESLIMPALRKLVGAPLNFDSVRAAVVKAVADVRRDGYSFFQADSVAFDYTSGSLDVYLDEGVIHAIRVEGLASCARFVVDRELEFAPGDLFRAEQAAQATNQLMRTGFFRDVRVEAVPLADSGVDVLVRLAERSTAVLRLSASVDNERYTQLGIEMAQENLFGHGTRVAGRVWGGVRDRAVVLDVRANRIYGSYWTFGLSGYAGYRNVNSFERTVDHDAGVIGRNILGEYRETRVGARARLGRQVERIGLFTVEGRFERQGLRNLGASVVAAGWGGVSTVKLGARFDTQDRVPFTVDGALVDLSYETSQSLFGADESFVKLGVDADFFASLGGGHVVHPRLRLGFGDATMPLLEQFTLGGQRSMFGLREEEQHGRQLFLTSLEYRYRLPVKIFFDSYVAMRYDLGATWGAPSQIRLNDLEHGIGMNVGLDTPVGPANFSLGRSFTFNKREAASLVNWGPFVAYFSLGYRFD